MEMVGSIVGAEYPTDVMATDLTLVRWSAYFLSSLAQANNGAGLETYSTIYPQV
jgi:hypothetical protein